MGMQTGTGSAGLGAIGGRAAARAVRRAHLLDRVVDAIRAAGPGISMDQLAAACGITKPLLYKHFGSRDGLVEAVAERFSDEVAGSVLGHLGRDVPPRAVFAATLEAYLVFIRRDTALYRFLRTHSDPEGIDLLV